jgi:hypothetical protein
MVADLLTRQWLLSAFMADVGNGCLEVELRTRRQGVTGAKARDVRVGSYHAINGTGGVCPCPSRRRGETKVCGLR